MSVILKEITWKSAADEEPVIGLSPITDSFTLTARKGLDIKNNICEFEVKNANNKYVNSTGEARFQEDDVFEVYAKKTTDASDIGADWKSSTNFLGAYYLKEISQMSTSARHRIKITSVDKAYVLFNRVHAQAFGFAQNDLWTSPGIFRKIVRINSTVDSTTKGVPGTDEDDGSRFDINAKFVSEGGSITDYRADTSTTLNGTITDSATTITLTDASAFNTDGGTIVIGSEHIYYAAKSGNDLTGCVRAIDETTAIGHTNGDTVYQGFPTVLFSKVWKPIYEWLSELGQPDNTNYASEQINDVLKYDRSFLVWVDNNQEIHYMPTTDTVDTTLVVGDNDLYEVSLEKAVFDSVNMVIYNVGEDMNGAGLNWYWYDSESETNDLKMRYQPMIDVMDNLLLEWIKYADNQSITLDPNTQDELRRFPDSGAYPLSDWSFKQASNNWKTIIDGESARTTLTSDTDFNDSLREAALWIGRTKAQNITARVGGLRYRGTITTNGVYYNPGDLIKITDEKTGIKDQLVRVLDVTQTISANQWATTLDVEEDPEALAQL